MPRPSPFLAGTESSSLRGERHLDRRNGPLGQLPAGRQGTLEGRRPIRSPSLRTGHICRPRWL